MKPSGNKYRSGTEAAIALLLALLLAFSIAGAAGCRSTPADLSLPENGQPGVQTETPGENSTDTSEDEPAFSFIVCGDVHNNYGVFNHILEAARDVDFLIIAGDLTGSGTSTELNKFRDVMENSGVRYYAVPGNHDVATSPVEENYTRILGPPYQSFHHLNSFFVLIDNSSPDLGFYPAMREWTRQELERARGLDFDHVFAVCHVPPGFPYSRRTALTLSEGVKANDHLVPVLSEGGVDQLFCGHFHAFSQWTQAGLTITITGGAGAPLHVSEQSGGYHHYLLVEIRGRNIDQQTVRI